MKYKTNLIEGNCLEIMPLLEESSFDLICADPPYGITNCSWDSVIPFNNHIYVDVRGKKKLMYRDEYALSVAMKTGKSASFWMDCFDEQCIPGMWENIKRLLKPNGAVVLFGSQPFTSKLVCSNLGWFKYEWIWIKGKATGFLDVKKKPLKNHENILVFAEGQTKYNPQKWQSKPYAKGGIVDREKSCKGNYGKTKPTPGAKSIDGKRFPVSAIAMPGVMKPLHPTQKPVALMEYLIKTYTDQGDSVLDFCMGSGSTGIACQNTGRHFAGIELGEKFFKIAQQRMKENNVLLVRG